MDERDASGDAEVIQLQDRRDARRLETPVRSSPEIEGLKERIHHLERDREVLVDMLAELQESLAAHDRVIRSHQKYIYQIAEALGWVEKVTGGGGK